MKEKNEKIQEYKNNLIKNNENSTKINMNIKNINDINNNIIKAKQELDKLQILSKDHKLYDKNYEEFRTTMGIAAMGINKSFKLNISRTEKMKLIDELIKLNNEFEILLQKNIVKDAYVWK